MKTCADCVHYGPCEDFAFGAGIQTSSAEKCKHFKDKSLIIEVPVKAGKTVYIPSNPLEKGIVTAIHITDGKRNKQRSHILADVGFGMRQRLYFDDYGLSWVRTREEMNAIKKKSEE